MRAQLREHSGFDQSSLEFDMQSLTRIPNMRRAEAAQYIREMHGIPCAPATLAKYACLGGGPAFRKAGKFPIYAREDLDAWAVSRLSKPVRSTSELLRS
jgi:hypothetical protein